MTRDYSPDMRERALRMLAEQRPEHRIDGAQRNSPVLLIEAPRVAGLDQRKFEPVEHRGGDGGVAEDLAPRADGPDRGDHDHRFQVALVDDLEQRRRDLGRRRKVARSSIMSSIGPAKNRIIVPHLPLCAPPACSSPGAPVTPHRAPSRQLRPRRQRDHGMPAGLTPAFGILTGSTGPTRPDT